MAKLREDINEPKPPEIPSAEGDSKPTGLDGWEPSEDPQDGRFVDHDDECDCPACDGE